MVNVGLSAGSILELGSNLFIPSFAQIVNVGFGPAGILGIIVAVAGAALYFLRSVRPELARDHDIFFAAVGLLCGGVLFFQGWRLDPILLFGQLLLTGSSIFFAVESIRLRQVATVQAKRSGGTPIFEEDPPFTRNVYDAELDEFGPAYDEPRRPQIRGRQDGTRRAYIDELPGENRPPRRSTSSRPSQRSTSSQRSGKSRPPRSDSRPARSRTEYSKTESEYPDPFDTDTPERTSERTPPVSGDRGSNAPRSRDGRRGTNTSSKSQKSRPRPDSPRDKTSADYVDYQPIDYPEYTNRPEQEQDNSANFDDDDNERV